MSQRNSTTALILHSLTTDSGIVQVAQRPTDGYIHLNPMAKAVGKEVFTWTRSKDTQEYFDVLSAVPQNCGTEFLQQIQGGPPKLQGTWAHPQPALKFAAWCDKRFEVQVWAWIDQLRTTGRVDLTAEPSNPIQDHLIATNKAIAYLSGQHGQLVVRVDDIEQNMDHLHHEMQYGFQKVEKRLELNRQAAIDRALRRAPKGHEQWWWRLSAGRCINPQCRKELNELAAPYAHNRPVYDEVIPISDGGKRCIANNQLICHACNAKKGAQWTDYRPPKILAQALEADIQGAQYHELLRQKLSRQPGLFDKPSPP
jgi:5-methylcytosine-specific restriction endonuclease McrA